MHGHLCAGSAKQDIRNVPPAIVSHRNTENGTGELFGSPGVKLIHQSPCRFKITVGKVRPEKNVSCSEGEAVVVTKVTFTLFRFSGLGLCAALYLKYNLPKFN